MSKDLRMMQPPELVEAALNLALEQLWNDVIKTPQFDPEVHKEVDAKLLPSFELFASQALSVNTKYAVLDKVITRVTPRMFRVSLRFRLWADTIEADVYLGFKKARCAVYLKEKQNGVRSDN